MVGQGSFDSAKALVQVLCPGNGSWHLKMTCRRLSSATASLNKRQSGKEGVSNFKSCTGCLTQVYHSDSGFCETEHALPHFQQFWCPKPLRNLNQSGLGFCCCWGFCCCFLLACLAVGCFGGFFGGFFLVSFFVIFLCVCFCFFVVVGVLLWFCGFCLFFKQNDPKRFAGTASVQSSSNI